MDAPPPYSEIGQDDTDRSHSSVQSGSHPANPFVPGASPTHHHPMIPNVPIPPFHLGVLSPPGMIAPPNTWLHSSVAPHPPPPFDSKPSTTSDSGPGSSSAHSSSQQRSCPWKGKAPDRRPSTSSTSSSSSSSSSCTSGSSNGTRGKDRCGGPSVNKKEHNKKVDWNQSHWQGKRFALQTKNAMVDVVGCLEATRGVHLATSNAAIQWRGDFITAYKMNIHTSNAKVDLAGGNITLQRSLKIKTSNARLLFEKIALVAKTISVITSNAEVRIAHAEIGRSLQVKTSNAPVHLFVKSSSGRSIHVDVSTSNAAVTLHMPQNFAGEFKLATSRTNAVIIEDRQDGITYSKGKSGSAREGYRFKKDRGSLKVSTSWKDITVVFDQ